jgi:hypothetical protein
MGRDLLVFRKVTNNATVDVETFVLSNVISWTGGRTLKQ